jgi:hypothetical protein
MSSAPSTRIPRGVAALLALNAALLAALALVVWSPAAEAQQRPRGDYTMVAGRAANAGPSVVWVVDQTNEELIALVWNAAVGRLEGLGYRSLVTDGSGMLRSRN